MEKWEENKSSGKLIQFAFGLEGTQIMGFENTSQDQ